MDNQAKGDNTPSAPQDCPRWCFPIAPSPSPSPPPPPESPSEGQVSLAPRQFNIDKAHLDNLDFGKDLAHITCGCGHGYFKPDKTWVSGSDVRAGLAPPKP